MNETQKVKLEEREALKKENQKERQEKIKNFSKLVQKYWSDARGIEFRFKQFLNRHRIPNPYRKGKLWAFPDIQRVIKDQKLVFGNFESKKKKKRRR